MASIRRSIPPSPPPTDSEFQNLTLALQPPPLPPQQFSARDRGSLVPSFPRSRYIPFHRHPKSLRLSHASEKTGRHSRCETRAPANRRRPGCVSVLLQTVVRNAK